jgi:glucose/arabinose dehydrogenase
MRNVKFLFVNLLLLSVSCANSDKPEDIPDSYGAVSAFPNLTFPRPVDLQHAGDNTNRIFVVEQAGVISVFPNDAAVPSKKTFLDIQARVNDSGNEEGLLGLAFHPNYESNGYFYVNYTASSPKRTVISRFTVTANADVADPDSEHIILEFDQPYSNHNGGQVSFGPDGFLYIASGDGGSSGDPQDNGQSLATLLGKILRIDVNGTEDGKQYAIPTDNPYKDNSSGFREEIYAYGLRNPWRFSFDIPTNQLWTGDVGQNNYEEIDIIEKGGNYGWNVMEGLHCFEPLTGCIQNGLRLPVWEYNHNLGISVTGGFVYRGPTLTELTGKYIFADFGSSRVWALTLNQFGGKPSNVQLFQAGFNVSSFGVDQNNELYLCGFDDKIYKLEKK